MAKKTEKAVETTETTFAKATTLLRKGTLAYIGLHGVVFERAKFRIAQARQASDGVLDTLVARGEKLESQAVTIAKGAQVKATETVKTGADKVREVLPFTANDRVEDLEAEIAALNTKISALSKKAAKKTPVSKVTKPVVKTDKTVKAA